MSARYHYTIGFPVGFQRPAGVDRLGYTLHAKQQADEDMARYPDLIAPPLTLDWHAARLIEWQLPDDGDARFLVRVRGSEKRDWCLVVIRCDRHYARVVTAWTNRRDDRHSTLDTSRYTKP